MLGSHLCELRASADMTNNGALRTGFAGADSTHTAAIHKRRSLTAVERGAVADTIVPPVARLYPRLRL